MAITSAIMQMRRGLEADFDPDKMRPGEWAVSTDKKYVRMCFSPGVCVRMATYEAFEADMVKIQKILEECQTIEDAVKLINSQVSEKLQATIEYTNQAKQYRNEAKESATNAYASANNAKSSEDKAKVSETNAKASETNAKISEENAQRVAESLPEDYTELSKAFYNTAIKQKAVGDNIHVTDSAEARNVEFGLYGKAEQKQYSGKNLLKNMATSKTVNGVTFTVNDDKSVTVNGTATATSILVINKHCFIKTGSYIMSGCPSGGGIETYRLHIYHADSDNNAYVGSDVGNGYKLTVEKDGYYNISIRIGSGITVNATFYPMISAEGGEYEPYVGGIPSPNPDYPQEITVAGASGSVEVVSCGKNLLQNTATSKTEKGITFTVNSDRSIAINGTSTGSINFIVNDGFVLSEGIYLLSQAGSIANSGMYIDSIDGEWFFAGVSGRQFEITTPSTLKCAIYIPSGTVVNNVTLKPMIRLASDTDDTYEPYTETASTIPTPDGLAGIKVPSGGNYTDENGQQWICDEIVKYADGSGEKIRKVGKEVFDGSEDEAWGTESTNQTNKRRINTSKIADLIKKVTDNNENFNGICSAFKIVPTGGVGTYGAKTGISCGMNGKIQVYSDRYNTTDVTIWTSYLSENPMTLYYELAEPIITDLSAEEIAEIEKLYTFYPITNISNDTDCCMSITYMADAKNYIDQRLALIESALINNI